MLSLTVSPRTVSWITLALEASPEVGAGPITTEVEGVALVEVETLPAGGVQLVAGGTGAPEGPVRVDAVPALAEVLHQLTLVEVLSSARPAAASPVRTEDGELLLGGIRAGLAGVAPGPAQCAAAGLPRHVTELRGQAVAGPVLRVAARLPPVLAVGAVGVEKPARRTLALEASLRVLTETGTAQVEVHQTLVDVDTLGPGAVQLKAPGTLAEVGAHHVLTDPGRETEAGLPTLVTVPTVETVRSELVPSGTVAGHPANSITAPPVTTQGKHGPALVNVLAVSLRSHLEASVTPAEVTSKGVDTGSIAADTGTARTFVNVHALLLVCGQTEAWLAVALETACYVGAVSICADPKPLRALVHISAVPAGDVQLVARRTLTVETARSVDTLTE